MSEETIAPAPSESAPTATPTEAATEAATSIDVAGVHEVMTEAFHGGKFYDQGTKTLDASKLGDSYTALLQNNLKKTDDLRSELHAESLKNRPEEASGYVFKPDEGLIPEGYEHVFADDDPTLEWFRGMSHEHGFSNDQFNTAVNKFVGDQTKRQMDNSLAHGKAEMDKLGERGTARIEAIEAWANGALSESSADALVGGLRDTIGNLHVSSEVVKALEEIMNIGKSDMSLPKDSIPASVTREQYEAETRAMMNSPEYIRGEASAQLKVAKRYESLYPGNAETSISAGFRR